MGCAGRLMYAETVEIIIKISISRDTGVIK